MEDHSTALALPDEGSFIKAIEAINRFQQVAHAKLISGLDYGVIPGTDKPTLLKPGAEKIAKLLGLADIYEILNMKEDWDKPFFRYMVKCKLVSVNMGVTVSEGMGECNSMEAKYRWRMSQRQCPECQAEAIIQGKKEYGGGWICFGKKGGCGAKFQAGDVYIENQVVGRVENDDIYSQVNTLLKMAKKRALVDAALSAGRLSDVFTQDMEDVGEVIEARVVKDIPIDPPDGLGPVKKAAKDTKPKIANIETLLRDIRLLLSPLGYDEYSEKFTTFLKDKYHTGVLDELSPQEAAGLLSALQTKFSEQTKAV